jgi:outer membrane protein assembly factor BamA
MLGGLLRSLVGANIAYVNLHDYTGQSVPTSARSNGHTVSAPEAPTLLTSDCASGRLLGCGGGWDNVLRLALSLDTRDFEPDPNSGVYAELSGEYGTRALASQYQYTRVMLSVRGFYSPIPRAADLVLAVRGLYEIQTTGTPFFSESILPFIDDDHAGLGGVKTLRGYAQNRFVGPIIALTNYELGWTFLKFHLLKQEIALIAVPFVDMGRVFDDVGQTTLGGWKRAQGAGHTWRGTGPPCSRSTTGSAARTRGSI